VTLLSPEEAVEKVVVYCRRRLRMPIAGWLSDGTGSPFRLIATRGIRGEVRASFWREAEELPPRSALNARVWSVQAERCIRALERRTVTWFDAGRDVFLIAGSLAERDAVVQAICLILRAVND